MHAIILIAALMQPVAPAAESRLTVAVRPTDIDSKGHVNNARYVEYLQWARWRWLEGRGLSDESLRAGGIVLVAVRIEVDYRAECRYGDTLEVTTTAAVDGPKKLVFTQEIRRPDGVLAAEAKVIMVAIDPASRKSVPLPDSIRAVADPGASPQRTRRVGAATVGGRSTHDRAASAMPRLSEMYSTAA